MYVSPSLLGRNTVTTYDAGCDRGVLLREPVRLSQCWSASSFRCPSIDPLGEGAVSVVLPQHFACQKEKHAVEKIIPATDPKMMKQTSAKVVEAPPPSVPSLMKKKERQHRFRVFTNSKEGKGMRSATKHARYPSPQNHFFYHRRHPSARCTLLTHRAKNTGRAFTDSSLYLYK